MEKENLETRFTTCTFCDGGCNLRVEIDGKDRKIFPLNPQLPAICSKAKKIDEYRLHKDRITKPLKNTGKRGEAKWQEVSWDEALDEIASRLKIVIKNYGPESVAFAETPLNTGFGGITRRLMNCIGTPNYTAPTQLCMGNTAQVNRAIYGWFVSSKWEETDLIVYFGQHRSMERWPAEYLKLNAALKRGAKLIVVDPRKTETAAKAHYHLPIRYGTDAALTLAWLHVIISEGLYDADFVENYCIGFEELCERVKEYSPEHVSKICGIDKSTIEETARLYAQANNAIIPWGVAADMQVNSTSFIQAQCILRSICGYLNKSEIVFGPAVGGVGNAELSAFEKLSQAQRKKQLGYTEHPLLSFAASEKYTDINKKFGINYLPDILAESNSCNPPKLFAAMRGEGPCPVKAIFSIGNNTVMSYAGQQGIIDGFMNQELVVVYENWMTPTAQLADFVLPGDMWAERSTLGPAYDVAPVFVANQAICEPVDECKDWYFVVKELADRLGYEQDFPWKTAKDLNDYRLKELGLTWQEMQEKLPAPVMRKPPAMGKFLTPSGKVELKSSVFEELGGDPLPSYFEPLDPKANSKDYPYILFAGLRENKSYNTCLHQIDSLRKDEPEPLVLINPADALSEEISDGDWCKISNPYGELILMAKLDQAQPEKTLRIPHGWWKPECEGGLENGLSKANIHNDGVLFPDDEWNLDKLQGVPGLRGGIHAKIKACCPKCMDEQ